MTDYRFELINPDGTIDRFHDGSAEVYASKAITRACRTSWIPTGGGTWEIFEWGTRIYKITRSSNPFLVTVTE